MSQTSQRTVKSARNTLSNSQEPILVHEPTATRPWFKFGSDIFEVKGKYYIVVADYYSRFPYVKQLTNITSRSIINVFKTLFADHGFCEILCTDNGPSYVSKEFTIFPNDCSIRHITSDPMYPQSNGFAESMVKVMKNLIIKAMASIEDPNWATPISASLPSPAQMLHGRPLRTNLPSPRPAAQSNNTLEAQSCRQQSYAQATSSKQLSPLREGQSVTMYNHNTHTWKPATITQVLPAPRSYQLSTNDSGDICATPSTTPNCVTSPHKPNCVIPNLSVSPTPPGCNSSGSNVTQPQNGSTHDGQYVTRYGRISKPTSRY